MHILIALIALIATPFEISSGEYGLAWATGVIGLFGVVSVFADEMPAHFGIWVFGLGIAIWNPLGFENLSKMEREKAKVVKTAQCQIVREKFPDNAFVKIKGMNEQLRVKFRLIECEEFSEYSEPNLVTIINKFGVTITVNYQEIELSK
jgi:hypothetical protein